jgi:hypothetical protein
VVETQRKPRETARVVVRWLAVVLFSPQSLNQNRRGIHDRTINIYNGSDQTFAIPRHD